MVEERGGVGQVGDPVRVLEAVVLEQRSEQLDHMGVEGGLPARRKGKAFQSSAFPEIR